MGRHRRGEGGGGGGVVKKIIKEKLGMDDIVIEKLTELEKKQVMPPGSHLGSATHGSSYSHLPRPIIVKFHYWKQKERY